MGHKLLLVEDDVDLTSFYQKLLTGKGYNVVTASDGEDGWTKLTNGTFDLVLLDIMMPKLDGIGFLKRKNEDERVKAVPVVTMTNVGTEEVLSQCFKLGVKYYILKVEVNPQEIPNILEKAMAEAPTSSYN